MSDTSPHLYADHVGLIAAGGVCERQAEHLAAVGRWVADVCAPGDAFRGVLAPFLPLYADALDSVAGGLDASGDAADRWGRAARETADDLVATDLGVRRMLERLADLLPAGVPDLTRLLAGATPAVPPGAAPPLAPCPVTPAPGESPVPAADLLGASLDHAGLGAAAAGPAGRLLGQVAALAKDRGELLDAAEGVEDDQRERPDVGDDLDRYDDFLGAGA